jgi:predicted RNA-binding Zn-ribbon protein involved in translation (DUF1610 family)
VKEKEMPIFDSCPNCGKALVDKHGDFVTDFSDKSGHISKLVTKNLSWSECPACGEQVFDNSALETIEAARRNAEPLLSQRLAKAVLKFIQYYGVSDSAQLVDRAKVMAERILADNPDAAMYEALNDLREAVSYSGYLKHDNEKLAAAMEKANNALVLARKVY